MVERVEVGGLAAVPSLLAVSSVARVQRPSQVAAAVLGVAGARVVQALVEPDGARVVAMPGSEPRVVLANV